VSTGPTDPPQRERRIVLVHDRGWKPDAAALRALWLDALGAGLDRDYHDAGGAALLDPVAVDLAYFGDLSNACREAAGQRIDPELDLEDRREALRQLSVRRDRKDFRRRSYERLPGRRPLRQFLLDIGAPLMESLRLSHRSLVVAMPDSAAYFDAAAPYRKQVQERLREPLTAALERDERIMLITHGLGSVLAYDVLWQTCHAPLDQHAPQVPRVHSWITLGSPLGDRDIRARLEGAAAAPAERYPTNLMHWFNVAAVDDFVCHDETVRDDFARMLDRRLISQIQDFRIYNRAQRFGRAHPHFDLGYLVHPRVSKLLFDWLQSG
jgi:hypothetical protein